MYFWKYRKYRKYPICIEKIMIFSIFSIFWYFRKYHDIYEPRLGIKWRWKCMKWVWPPRYDVWNVILQQIRLPISHRIVFLIWKLILNSLVSPFTIFDDTYDNFWSTSTQNSKQIMCMCNRKETFRLHSETVCFPSTTITSNGNDCRLLCDIHDVNSTPRATVSTCGWNYALELTKQYAAYTASACQSVTTFEIVKRWWSHKRYYMLTLTADSKCPDQSVQINYKKLNSVRQSINQ